MSIVGPRPLLVEYLEYYTEEEHHRHDVRPGLTGLAQVRGRNAISWEEKFNYDIEYVNNVTFLSDVKIFFETIKVTINQQNVLVGNEFKVGKFIDQRREKLKV